MTRAEVLDPRYDAEPTYWAALRKRAGLRADWSWSVLATQAWCARSPQLVTVLHGDDEPVGVVWAASVGPRTRRHRFALDRGAGPIGLLDVRSPGSGAVPGWWFDGYHPATAPAGAFRELIDGYLHAVRRELGRGVRAVLLRQVGEPEVAEVAGRLRVVRPTEPVARLHTASFASREEWLAGLSKNRRKNFRRVTRMFDEDPNVLARYRPGSEEDPARMAELMRFNEVKHRDVPIVPLPLFNGYLSALLTEPDVFVFSYTARDSGALLGACVVLDHPRWPVARAWSALPQALGGPPHLYFHFYGAIMDVAIESGKHGVIAGKKMAEVKKSMGAELVAQYAAARVLC